MSDETAPQTEAAEAAETTTAEGEAAEAESEGGTRRQTPRVGIHSLLTRDSDAVARPGFRNPSNSRSKAQKKSKAKKKGKKRR